MPATLPPSIFNDVIGPVMRGPSSSHSAASVRIGRLARDLCGGTPDAVRIEFDTEGSLATTHDSQGSDMGLFGGLLGWEADDPRLPDSAAAVRAAGIDVRIEIAPLHDPHPNTYRLAMSKDGALHRLVALSTGGGMIDVRDRAGATRILLRGEELTGSENGAAFEMFADDGTEVVEFDSGFNAAGGAFLDVTGSYAFSGTKSASVPLDNGEKRLVYCQESTEIWFEDFGSGQLVNGHARIDLDPMFLETVTINEQHPMKVFITLNGECFGVWVQKGNDHFYVHELANGLSNAEFDFRVVAKREGWENVRMERFEDRKFSQEIRNDPGQTAKIKHAAEIDTVGPNTPVEPGTERVVKPEAKPVIGTEGNGDKPAPGPIANR